MEDISGTLNKEKTEKLEMNNSTESKNPLEGINRLQEAKEGISNLEDRLTEGNEAEQERENGNKFREPSDSIEQNHTCSIEIPGGERKGKIVQHFPNLGKEKYLDVGGRESPQ